MPEEDLHASARASDPSSIRLYEIRESYGRGLGLFANRDIGAGTRILAESPLMVLSNGHYLKSDVEDAYKALDPVKQAKFERMASAHGQSPSQWPSRIHGTIRQREKDRIQEQHDARIGPEATLLSIYMTNAMQWGPDSKGSAVFETAARINHSCIPNAHFAWNESLEAPDGTKGLETVHATQDIRSGDEIVVSYCDPLYDLTMRRWELQHYGFRCDCKACVDPSVGPDEEPSPTSFAAASKERRYRLRELDESLGRSQYGYSPAVKIKIDEQKQLALLLEEIGLMREEGLINPKLSKSFLAVAEVCRKSRDFKSAIRAAQEGYKTIVTCLGADSSLARSSLAYIEMVRAESEAPLIDQEVPPAG